MNQSQPTKETSPPAMMPSNQVPDLLRKNQTDVKSEILGFFTLEIQKRKTFLQLGGKKSP